MKQKIKFFKILWYIITKRRYIIKRFFKKHWKTLLFLSTAVLLLLFILNFKKLSVYFEYDTPYGYGELFRVFLTVVAGVGAVFIVYFTAKRVKVMEEQTKKTVEHIQTIYKGNVDTRFNNAVGHLGNEKSSVILGGIHALHEIAVENKNYRHIVNNLFCSYIRENSKKLNAEINFKKTPDKCPVIIQMLIDYLFKPYNGEDSVYKDYESDLSHSILKNCNFWDTTLNECKLNNATLDECDFRDATLNECKFWDADLTECDFRDATLIECDFRDATLTKCDFWIATLNECKFRDATLNECDFRNATLDECDFKDADLAECDFRDATLKKCDFISKNPEYKTAKLTDCDFENAKRIYTKLPPNETS